MNKNKKIFIITITFLMLLGLTTITATDINDTTTLTQITQSTINTPTTETTQTTTIKDEAAITKEVSPSQTDDKQEKTDNQETLNEKNEKKTQNLKASRTVEVSTFDELNNTLTSNSYDTITINIGNTIQLAGSITVNNAIKTLIINGNEKTINGNNKYQFLNINNTNTAIKNLNVINCNFTTGGALYINNANLTITNCVFNNNHANGTIGKGGAIFNQEGNLSIINSTFKNNQAYNRSVGYGGGIYNNNTNVTIIDSVFNNNFAYEGGAIYNNNSHIIYNNNNINVIRTTFDNNNAKHDGGAIHNYWRVNMTIIDSKLHNNYVNYSGGAISILWGSNLTIFNSTLNNNTAYGVPSVSGDGGAIHLTDSEISIYYSNFTNNKALGRYGHGGAIGSANSNVYYLKNCNFLNNTADDDSGAMHIQGNLTIENCNFMKNNAPNQGGAILSTPGQMNIINSTFQENNATEGGAIFNGGNLTIINSNLTNNKATNGTSGYGGAIYSKYVYTNLTIINSIIKNNTAYEGGAIHHNGTLLYITNSTLNNNSATTYGGAIKTFNATSLIENVNFTNNTAIEGGAISNEGNLTVTDSLFMYNNATTGGTINTKQGEITITEEIYPDPYYDPYYDPWYNPEYVEKTYIITSNLNITNSKFLYNNATQGGAINSSYSKSTITNSSFIDNTATYGGGAIVNYYGNLTIYNSTLNNNNATWNGGAINGDYITITNTILNNNNANTGGAIRGYNLIITNTTLTNNTKGAIYGSNITIINSNINNTGGIIGYGNILVTNSNLTNNNASQGGAISIQDYGANITIINSTLNNNTAGGNGGAIYQHYGSNITIINSTLNNNTASSNGGAIYGRNSNITIMNTKFTNNTSGIGGAIYGYENNTITISNTTLTNNNATRYYGGAIYGGNYTNIIITQSNLTHNNANSSGGAISGANIIITQSNLTHNNANSSGGAISGSATITNSTLNNNIAKEYGGGAISGSATITNSTLNNNIAYIGGVIHGVDITIRNSTLNNNTATQGGAIYNVQNSLILKNSNITNNYVTNVGYVVYSFANSNSITDNIFINNTNNIRDMLFYIIGSTAIHNNSYIDNLLEVTSIKPNVTIVTDNEAKSYDYHIDLNLRSIYNDTVRNGTLKVYVNDVLTDTVEVINGSSLIFIENSDLTKRENNITLGYISQSKHYQNTTIRFKIKKDINTTITIQAPSKMNVGDTAAINFTLNDVNNKAVSGETIHIIIDEKNINMTTDSNGVANYIFNANNDKLVHIVAKYQTNNDSFYNNAKDVEAEINVTKKDVEMEIVIDNQIVDNTTLNVILTDSLTKDPLPNATVIVTLPNGKKIGEEKTDENGTAIITIDLPSGDNNITIKYLGNDNYKEQEENRTLRVKSYSVVTVDAVEGVVLDNVTFTVNVRDYLDNPVTGGYVQFSVGGRTLKDENGNNIRVLVENGIAKLSYTAESGWIIDTHPDLTVQAVYTGTSIVLANRSDASKVSIYKRNATVTVSAPDDYVNGTLHIDAVVQDQNGSLINDGNLVFKLNGLSLKDENNKGIIAQVINGKVHIDVKLPFAYSAKEYNLTAIYSNKIYNKATGSNTTTLKAIPIYVNAIVVISDEFSKPVISGQIYNQFNNAILEGTTTINIKFDGISYAKKVVINNGTFTETLEGISIYKPGTHTVEIAAGANSHYDAVRQTYTTKATPKYDATPVITNITRNKTTTRVQAKIVDDKNKNVQKDLKITIKINGLSFLVNQTVRNGKVDVLIDTSTLKNRTYNLELVSGANTYYNAGSAKTELPKY